MAIKSYELSKVDILNGGRVTNFLVRAIGEKLFANSGKKRYNEFEVKKDVKH